MHKIGIIGNGFVGKATLTLQCDDIEVLCYDINPELCVPKGTTLHDLMACCAVFVSVPTPINAAGKTSMKYVDAVLAQLRELSYGGFTIIRSTVPVGTSDHYNCCFMPEFLTEKNAIHDFVNNSNWIFGCNYDENKDAFMALMTSIIRAAHAHKKIAHDRITFMHNKEAEMVKYFRNTFLATKISFCNEIHAFCNKQGIDYARMVDVAAEDARICKSHTAVPGHDGRFGFGGTCFPKDISSLRAQMAEVDVQHTLVDAVIYRNDTIDRAEKDWMHDVGRAVVKDL
jgi:nucleotide sugar dehydrogenase